MENKNQRVGCNFDKIQEFIGFNNAYPHFDIAQERGHWVAYIDGEEYCTGDTYLEVVQELTEDGYL